MGSVSGNSETERFPPWSLLQAYRPPPTHIIGKFIWEKMYLSNTRLTLPWNLGYNNNNAGNLTRTFTTYEWRPDPLVSSLVLVVMLVITLVPAFCSLCYHIYIRTDGYKKEVF